MILGFILQPPHADLELTTLEDAAVSDNQTVSALLDYLLQEEGSLTVRKAGDFCEQGDIIIPEAEIRLASQSLRTSISHMLTLDEAGQGAPLPFLHPPVMKIDGTRIPVGPTDVARISRVIRSAWAQTKVVSPLSTVKEN